MPYAMESFCTTVHLTEEEIKHMLQVLAVARSVLREEHEYYGEVKLWEAYKRILHEKPYGLETA